MKGTRQCQLSSLWLPSQHKSEKEHYGIVNWPFTRSVVIFFATFVKEVDFLNIDDEQTFGPATQRKLEKNNS